MAGNQQLKESRVVKVDSEESWDLFFSQATNQGCPVSLLVFVCNGLQTHRNYDTSFLNFHVYSY